MVQDMPTPVITSRDQYKPSPIYMNGINGSNGTTTTHHLRTSRSPPCPPQLPIPMPMPPMPLGPIAHHQPHGYFQSMGPPPPPPAMAAVHPAAAAAAAAAAAQVAVSGPSPPTPHQPPPPPPPQLYATSPEQPTQSYCDYLYHVGFLQGLFSDITVTVPALQKSYALHSLILSRSPVLYRRLVGRQPHQTMLEIDLRVSPEAFHTIVGHLYRPLSQQDISFLTNEKPQVCLELLEAAQELELEKLQNQILHVLGQNLNQNSVFYWMAAVIHAVPHRRWVDVLDQHVLQYLVSVLPAQLGAFETDHDSEGDPSVCLGLRERPACSSLVKRNGQGATELAHIYASLPLQYLKRCLEHRELVRDSIQRYRFAKQVLHFREQKGRRGLSVVLRFTGDNDGGSGIMIVRKQAYKAGRWDPSAEERRFMS